MQPPYVLPPSTQLALTDEYPPRPFRNLQACSQTIHALRDRLYDHNNNNNDPPSEYITFHPIPTPTFHTLNDENHRALLGAIRITFFPDIATLLLKLPTPTSEKAHRSFAEETVSALAGMGVRVAEREPTGAGAYTAPSGSVKEADSSYRNGLLDAEWPCLVIEAATESGESARRLEQAAAWVLTIEKYFPQRRQQQQRQQAIEAGETPPCFVPELIARTEVNVGVAPPFVEGPPVVLEFGRVIGRPPVAPEQDVVFGYAKLVELALMVFH